MDKPTINIENLDLSIILIYLVGIVAIGCWAGLRRRTVSEGRGYFLAGKSLAWPVIGLALFSTNISTTHLVSLAQAGYQHGLAYGNFEWMAAFTLIALALFFAPFYIRSGVATLPDFLEKRYNRACRDWLAILSIIAAVFLHISFSLYAGALVLQSLFGFDIHMSIIVTAGLSGLYTIIGGLMAVAITEAIQTVILVGGAMVITVIGLSQVGGWSGLTSSVDPVQMTVLRSGADASELPWYAVLLGYPVIGLWYWCADQTIVQRVLGAKDENHARVGALFAGFIKILPVFIFVLPGLICAALISQGKIVDKVDDDGGNVLAVLIDQLLPVGLKGVMAAALLAALMSTVAGALNSIATLFSYDIYRRLRPATADHTLVIVGRVATFVAMAAAILWSPHLNRFESLFKGLNMMICYIAPPITAVFVWGVFWKKASARGAFATLVLGSLLGFVVFLLDLNKEHTGWNVPFMMMAFYLFVICSLILTAGSLIWPQKNRDEIESLVWQTPLHALKGEAWKGIGNYKILTAILFVTMVILYAIFR
jgi:SSS family solute:Na+ symporter